VRVSEARARSAYQEMVRDEIAFLRSQPEMRVRPFGEFGREKRVVDCDSGQVEYVARRNVERAVERALRNKNAATEA
jgi:hypothetical protein